MKAGAGQIPRHYHPDYLRADFLSAFARFLPNDFANFSACATWITNDACHARRKRFIAKG
jgi:hypothetical protein